ncbi:hypothetical protein Daura_39945 [Dactylosporangium aurantiacum]|uniref:Uncharacterized protein n=1 Tax=Dactylosporangium aurantiacum TaxID=35754 RepID=A0A9Q9IEB7_9ACTN|nr:hypothetical protein [Dactylosporangium aurantiacum]MDG6101401.1 hypothetical protein [Dactylosporangium aurantiacum]UWZ52745.1 hypothetical protein Daura_39945 [Dactylosporangium aurantiacum]
MSSDRVEIDPEGIMRSGDGILTAAQVIQREITAFQGELAAYGEPWGTDDVGSLIGMVYGVISDLAFETYTGNTDEIGQIGALTRRMGENYVETETGNRTDLNSYKQALGGG